MNYERYPWLLDLSSNEAKDAINNAKQQYITTGAVIFHDFITKDALMKCLQRISIIEENTDDHDHDRGAVIIDAHHQHRGGAYTTDDQHTAYLKPVDYIKFDANSVYNHEMRTIVASIPYDELNDEDNNDNDNKKDSNNASPVSNKAVCPLVTVYEDPTLLRLVASIIGKHANEDLFLSADPLGCCSINVFRPGYYHSFHFDESEFSTTIMIQEAEAASHNSGDDVGERKGEGSGLFQHTHPLRNLKDDLALPEVAAAIQAYDPLFPKDKKLVDTDDVDESEPSLSPPALYTLDLRPGTLSIFSGSKSLHRVTKVLGGRSRYTAILTYAPVPDFCNSPSVQTLFWGRPSPDPIVRKRT